MRDDRSPEEQLLDAVQDIRSCELSELCDDVRRIATAIEAIGGQLDAAIEAPVAINGPREKWLQRESARHLRVAYDKAMADRSTHASVPTPALGMVLELIEPRRRNQ